MMDRTVHQVWFGGKLPKRVSGWVESVRAAAERAGWRHRLWSWEEVYAAYGGEAVTRLFARLMEDFPISTTYSLASDYYRLRLLADGGGVYLDADYEARAWPVFPEGAALYMTHERRDTRLAASACLVCHVPEVCRLAANMAACELEDNLPLDAPDLPMRYVEYVRQDKQRFSLAFGCIGPGWLRRYVLPALQGNGYACEVLPLGIAGHAKGDDSAALLHMGEGSWVQRGHENAALYWHSMAEKASAKCHDNKYAMHLIHRSPCGSRVVGARAAAEAKPAGGVVVVNRPAARASHKAAFMLRLPRGTRRVVVLSNVTRGFAPDMVPLGAGDLVLHCNHARHAAAAMGTAGTHHWLFVRHGKGKGGEGRHWYHDGGFDGFEKVFFIDSAMLMHPFRWHADFCAVSSKSPTTGFVVANVMRELYPHVPLVLGGFAPGQDHGTPLWRGHDWAAEAEWYARRGFVIIPPH